MATTSLWKIRARLDHVVDYVSNADKTQNKDFGKDLAAVVEYAGESYKTEQRHFVSGINCSPETAYSAMLVAHTKNDRVLRVLGYHGYQSFMAGEVNAETAHAIGVQLAQEMWGARFQVVVATHLNTGHYHNHFVVCATSIADGKRYNYNGKERHRMMQISDRLCKEHSLSVVETPQRRAVEYAEWRAEQAGQPTKRSLVRADIDAALTGCLTPKQFTQAIERMGYVLNFNRKHPTLRGLHAERAFRFDSLGAGYSMDDIKARIAGNYRKPAPQPKPEPPPRSFKKYKYKGAWKSNSLYHSSRSGAGGLRALYYHYCYLLGVCPRKRTSNKRMHAVLHDDLIRLDKTIKASRLLFAHQIDTQEQLFAFMAQNTARQTSLTGTRQYLRRNLRKETAPETQDALKRQIAAVSEKLKALRDEQKICEDVAARSGIVAERVRQVTQAQHTQINRKRKENVYEPRR